DKKNKKKINKLFNILKKNFEHIIVISHTNTVIKKWDYKILVGKKENDYSYVKNVFSEKKEKKILKNMEKNTEKITDQMLLDIDNSDMELHSEEEEDISDGAQDE